MSRIDSILKSSLFSNAKMREILNAFIKTRLGFDDNQEFELTKIPLSLIFDYQGIFNEEISRHVRDSKFYINFDHYAGDPKLQKLFFITLIYSYKYFPDSGSWEVFINSDIEQKRRQIIQGIEVIWSEMTKQIINQELLEEVEKGNNELDLQNLEF